MKIKATEVVPGNKIVDLDGNTIIVDDVWPSQGVGLGAVIRGHLLENERKESFNRYNNPDFEVELIEED